MADDGERGETVEESGQLEQMNARRYQNKSVEERRRVRENRDKGRESQSGVTVEARSTVEPKRTAQGVHMATLNVVQPVNQNSNVYYVSYIIKWYKDSLFYNTHMAI